MLILALLFALIIVALIARDIGRRRAAWVQAERRMLLLGQTATVAEIRRWGDDWLQSSITRAQRLAESDALRAYRDDYPQDTHVVSRIAWYQAELAAEWRRRYPERAAVTAGGGRRIVIELVPAAQNPALN